MHASLINEHNIRLGLISLFFLFFCLSGIEKLKKTTIVSYKYQSTRQDTESIDKRSSFLMNDKYTFPLGRR